MKRVVCVIATLCMVAGLFALDGVVIKTTGKVEMQKSDASWVTLKEGDTVPEGAVISTGFKSSADIKLGGSLLSIAQLTRITLRELTEDAGKVTTDLFLDAGACLSNVKPLDNKANDYKVQTAAVTASVRGTDVGMSLSGNTDFDALLEQGQDAILRDEELFGDTNTSEKKPADSMGKLESAKGMIAGTVLVPEGKVDVSSQVSNISVREGQSTTVTDGLAANPLQNGTSMVSVSSPIAAPSETSASVLATSGALGEGNGIVTNPRDSDGTLTSDSALFEDALYGSDITITVN